MPLTAFTCADGHFQFSEEMKKTYDEDGVVLVKGLLSKAEVNHVENAIVSGPYLDYKYANVKVPSFETSLKVHTDLQSAGRVAQIGDGEGSEIEHILWCYPGNDITGMVSRSEKVAGTAEKLLGGEVFLYQAEVTMKPPGTGGQFLWHQDYGYWYDWGFLRPDMLTAFIAIDKCMRSNGCLQVLKGSHKIGRLDHSKTSGQYGVAEIDRIQELKKTFSHEYVELDPGDAIFFNCNLLHYSSGNYSDKRRWVFVSCFNKADNRMLNEETSKKKRGHGTPITKVPDDAILACKDFTNMEGKCFNRGFVQAKEPLLTRNSQE